MAAMPTLPVIIGAAAPEDRDELGELEPELELGEAAVGDGMDDDGVVIPDVKGTVVTEEAPENATDWVDWVGIGVAAVLFGLRTL